MNLQESKFHRYVRLKVSYLPKMCSSAEAKSVPKEAIIFTCPTKNYSGNI